MSSIPAAPAFDKETLLANFFSLLKHACLSLKTSVHRSGHNDCLATNAYAARLAVASEIACRLVNCSNALAQGFASIAELAYITSAARDHLLGSAQNMLARASLFKACLPNTCLKLANSILV